MDLVAGVTPPIAAVAAAVRGFGVVDVALLAEAIDTLADAVERLRPRLGGWFWMKRVGRWW